jgi:geranylgeranyl reductase family protein
VDRTLDADVLIVGAGPAGSAAAIRFAEHGFRVLLCDRRAFPRDKTCGDGLIADSINALRSLGLLERVQARACAARRLTTVSPSGISVHFDSTFLILPRRDFDQIIFERALASGAEFRQLIVERPLLDQGQVIGVIARVGTGEERVTLRATLTVLATGAESRVLGAFDPSARQAPSGFAIRTYAHLDGRRPLADLIISLERDLLPGYAWAFPVPGGLINVGVGWLAASRAPQDQNLRRRLDELMRGTGVLGGLLGPTTAIEPYRGAPLRTGLRGAQLAQPGLAVIGEAAGTTYAVSGEGIGKAMESGLILASVAGERRALLARAGYAYADLMRARYGPRFQAYTTAQWWLRYPFVADYVARRANQSAWVHERLRGVLEEHDLPDRVFSARSLWKLVMRR